MTLRQAQRNLRRCQQRGNTRKAKHWKGVADQLFEEWNAGFWKRIHAYLHGAGNGYPPGAPFGVNVKRKILTWPP